MPSYTFRGDMDSRCVQIWWKSAVGKLPKPSLCRSRPSPHFASTWPITPTISETLLPLNLCKCTNFGPDWMRFGGVIAERLIFGYTNLLQYWLKPLMQVPAYNELGVAYILWYPGCRLSRRYYRKSVAFVFVFTTWWLGLLDDLA